MLIDFRGCVALEMSKEKGEEERDDERIVARDFGQESKSFLRSSTRLQSAADAKSDLTWTGQGAALARVDVESNDDGEALEPLPSPFA